MGYVSPLIAQNAPVFLEVTNGSWNTGKRISKKMEKTHPICNNCGIHKAGDDHSCPAVENSTGQIKICSCCTACTRACSEDINNG